MMSNFLLVHFYNPHSIDNDRDESMFNRTVASFDPPFCHCELQFMNEESITVYQTKRCPSESAHLMSQHTSHCACRAPKQYDAAYASAIAL